jgi:hypothetical protein
VVDDDADGIEIPREFGDIDVRNGALFASLCELGAKVAQGESLLFVPAGASIMVTDPPLTLINPITELVSQTQRNASMSECLFSARQVASADAIRVRASDSFVGSVCVKPIGLLPPMHVFAPLQESAHMEIVSAGYALTMFPPPSTWKGERGVQRITSTHTDNAILPYQRLTGYGGVGDCDDLDCRGSDSHITSHHTTSHQSTTDM